MKLSGVLFDSEALEHPSFVPFVDVLLFLLFFTLTADLGAQQFSMAETRPGVSDPQVTEVGPKDLRVEIAQGGQFVIDGNQVSIAGLEEEVKRAKATQADLVVFYDGDAQARWGSIVKVIEICDRLGVVHRPVVNKLPES
jgi:biopolymer transport protein ExbD